MKYPYICIIRDNSNNHIDNIFNSYKDVCDFTPTFTNNMDCYQKLITNSYYLIALYKININELKISERMKKRVITIDVEINEHSNIDVFKALSHKINTFYINILSNRENIRPAFSIFTSCYFSYGKINRAYQSLLKQTFQDWEWVIIDDTCDSTNAHFNYLSNNLKDKRIRLFNKNTNTGSIGDIKNEAVSLCRGKYCLELDHDDEITDKCLELAYNAFESNDKLGFVYMDFINMYENKNPFFYGDPETHEITLAKGYGGYYSQRYNGSWQYVYVTPNVNNITLSHLVCCPNHPRIWKTSVLKKCGNYNELLPICDDYEILLKTLIDYECCKINCIGYIQYMNDGNNNFSLIRNKEINRIGPKYIMPYYFEKYNVSQKMKNIDSYEDDIFIHNHSNIWKRDSNYTHKRCNKLVNENIKNQILIFDSNKLADIEKYMNVDESFIYLLSNNKTLRELQESVDINTKNIAVWSFANETKTEIIKFFNMLLKNDNSNVLIID